MPIESVRIHRRNDFSHFRAIGCSAILGYGGLTSAAGPGAVLFAPQHLGCEPVLTDFSSLVVAVDLPGPILEFRNVLLQPHWAEPDVLCVHNDKPKKNDIDRRRPFGLLSEYPEVVSNGFRRAYGLLHL